MNDSNKGNNNVFYKIYFDKNEDLTCVYFDFNDFNVDYNLMELFLAHKKPSWGESSNVSLTYYSDKGALKIDDFIARTKRRWHGRIMLRGLLEIIPHLNKRIEEINESRVNEKYAEQLKPIRYVYGKIKAGAGITDEELVEFYKREGFYNKGRLYREV